MCLAAPDNCMLCGGTVARTIFSGPDRVLGLPGEYSVIRCTTCGLARTEPQIPVEDRAKYYEPEEKPEPGKDARIVFYQGRLAARIDKAVTEKNRRVLDIGCGEGVFLDLMRNLGWETMGVEIGEESSRIAREKGLTVITGDLFSRDIENRAFDAVVMSHVLEHLDDPVASLERVRDLLKPRGLLMLSLPNYRCLEAKLFKEDWYCWMLPPHLYHFDVRSVRMALEKAELTVDRVSYLPFFFLVQSMRYALKRDQRRTLGNMEEPAGSGSRPKNVIKTAVFKTVLTISSLAGRVMSGEIMEVMARK